MRMLISIVTVVSVTMLIAGSTATAYADMPPLPHAFYGHVLVNGEPAPVGTEIEARGAGVETGIEGNPMTVTTAGRYGGPNWEEKKLVVQGDVAPGTLIEFYVDGVLATPGDPELAGFKSGEVTELHLSATIPDPPPPPPRPPTPPPPPPPAQYNLTIDSTDGGQVTEPGEGVFAYDAGTVVSLIAEPDDGYRFVYWTGDVDTITNVEGATTTITLDGDYSITADFEVIPEYHLTVDCTKGGKVAIPGEGTFAYGAGTVVELVATPDNAYRFVNWTGDVATITDVSAVTTTITMNGNYSVTANFGPVRPFPFPWWWIVIGVVVVGLVVYFLLRRRRSAARSGGP